MFKPVFVIAAAVAAGLAAGQGVLALDRSLARAAPATVAKAADGHFWAEGRVEGRPVRFLVDTGATTVALTPEDAARLGVDLDALAFDRAVKTASGQVRAARVMLDRIAVAGAEVRDVEALVIEDGLHASLLGMSYLGRLSRIEATPTALVLRP